MAKKTKSNPHCPVVGCSVKQPHADDFLIKMLAQRFAVPDKCLPWVLGSLCELRDSMIDDYNSNRHLGWLSRLRQIEELYFRTLYILFLATEEETPHILSGDTPNSLTSIYKKVNEEILFGQGVLLDTIPGQSLGQSRPIDILHSGAHVGFRAMQMVLLVAEHADESFKFDAYLAHIKNYIIRVDHMRGLFEAGRDKNTVRQAITNMHRPKEYWEQKAKEAREAQIPPPPSI